MNIVAPAKAGASGGGARPHLLHRHPGAGRDPLSG